jgi:hypothetical protein
MYYYVYAAIASILIGVQMFSLKLMSEKKEWFYRLVVLIIATLIVSRFLIFEGMKRVSNPTLVHLILNLSVFVTFFASYLFLNVSDFDYRVFFLGIVFITMGTGCIQLSYK